MWLLHLKWNESTFAGMGNDMFAVANAINQWGTLALTPDDPSGEDAKHEIRDTASRWIELARHVAAEIRDRETQEARAIFKAEAQEAANSHKSLAFRLRKREPRPPLATVLFQGHSSTFPVHVLESYADTWGKWWEASAESAGEQDFEDLLKEYPTDDLPRLSPEQIRQVALTFAAATAAPDGLPARAVAALSDACLTGLAAQYELWHRFGWPQSEQHVITVLIPKRDGGLRPSALFRTLYRTFSRAPLGLRSHMGRHTGEINNMQ
jgi:hypothetical protein